MRPQISKRLNGRRVILIPEIENYRGMIARCYRKTHKNYARYGGRGIKVCERWLGKDGFWNFLEDMGTKPTPKHSIDRMDNDDDYKPSNCRWATQHQQNRNNSRNRYVTINGQTKILSDWCNQYDIKLTRIYNRTKLGWSIEDAITVPLGKNNYYGQLKNR